MLQPCKLFSSSCTASTTTNRILAFHHHCSLHRPLRRFDTTISASVQSSVSSVNTIDTSQRSNTPGYDEFDKNYSDRGHLESLPKQEPDYDSRFREERFRIFTNGSGSSTDEDTDGDDETIQQITKIPVPRQNYIPVSKVSLVQSLRDCFKDEEEASEFLLICSFLDFIFHAEHKTILEQMRVDYKITRSSVKKEADDAKNKGTGKQKRKKRKLWLKKVAGIWNRGRKKSKSGKTVYKAVEDQLSSSDPQSSNGSVAANVQGESSNDANGAAQNQQRTYSSGDIVPDKMVRNSIAAAARFQRNFLKLLKNARFQGLSARDLQLTSALNTDYLLTLPIELDWRSASSEIALIYRRGYAAERQEGFLFGAKFDYLQSLLLRKIFNGLSGPLFRAGMFINEWLKRSREKDGTRGWAEDITEWLNEPLQPEDDDDLSTMIVDSLSDEEKENYLPFRIATQQAVPRYEAFLSSVGSRGVLLRKILVWMRLLPPESVNIPLDLNGKSASESLDHFRGNGLTRISMRDIWLPASKLVCGGSIWKQIRASFSVFFSRSTLQEPAYRELVVLYNVPCPSDLDTDDDVEKIPNLGLKIYGKIPIPDLKVIFPNKKLSFRILDTVRLDIATVIGLLAFLINYRFDDFLSSPSAFVLDIIASSALIVYLTRVILGYKQTYDRYQLLVNKTLYEKTLASGFGAVHFLVDASEQQQFKETVLALAILMQAKSTEMETRESLAAKCEHFLRVQFQEQVEMPVDEAIKNLSRLGLIVKEECSSLSSTTDVNRSVIDVNGTVCHRARSSKDSLKILQERWCELLSDGSTSSSFMRSLYNTEMK